MAQHGGKRPGAGHPRGPTAVTLSKQAGRELVRQAVLKHVEALVAAQVANAQGLKYLVVRDKRSGKFVRVTEAMARQLEGKAEAEHETVEIWEKDPSVQAFTDLMNRALDKPAEAEPDQPWKGELIVGWKK
jgi:lipopolysaccharide biosynthesis regulator YciM